jgi:choline dehydrogenase
MSRSRAIEGDLEGAAADVVVAGGGTAGCVVAARLAEAGADVLLLEGGRDYGPLTDGRWPVELLDATTLPVSHDWGCFGGTGAGGQDLTFDRARVIGGCSSVNGSAQTVGWRGDYDAWGQACPGWSAGDLEPAFDRAKAATRVRVPREDEVQPFQAAFLEACEAAGVPRTDDLGDLDGGLGVGVTPVNIEEGRRINTAVAYLDPLRDRPNLRVAGGVLIDRVTLVDGRADGVVAIADGRPVTVRGDLVVVCAGAYGTPAILQRSGIGESSRLRARGIDPLVELPGVGRGLQDQPTAVLWFRGTPELERRLAEHLRDHGFLPEEQCIAKVSSGRGDGAPYDAHVFPWVEPDGDGWRCAVPVALLSPHSAGTVEVTGPDPSVAPRVDHRYLEDPVDEERMVALIPLLREIVLAEPLAPLIGDVLDTTPWQHEDLRPWLRRTHEHYWHPTGGARMGPDGDPHAVVDHRLRVRGVDGLAVVDASVFPSIPRATTALPVTAVAERAATLLGAPAG